MIEVNNNIFDREHRDDSLDALEIPANTLRKVDSYVDNTLESIGENEQVILGNTIKIKSEGVIKEMIVEDNKVILKEI